MSKYAIQAEIERKKAGLELVEVFYQITVDKKMFIEMPIEKMKMVDDPSLDVFFEIEKKVQEAEPNYVLESFSFNGRSY